MEIHLEGRYTEQDIRRAVSLTTWAFRGGAILFTFLTLFILVWSIGSIEEGPIEDPLWLVPMFLPVLLPGILAVALWILPWLQARQAAQAPLLKGLVSGVVTDEELVLNTEQSESSVRWDAFTMHRMSDHIVLLHQSKAAATMVARSLFASDEDWDRFREQVKTAVPREAKHGPRWLRWMLIAIVTVMTLVLILNIVFWILD
jgi:hypothetical protein